MIWLWTALLPCSSREASIVVIEEAKRLKIIGSVTIEGETIFVSPKLADIPSDQAEALKDACFIRVTGKTHRQWFESRRKDNHG